MGRLKTLIEEDKLYVVSDLHFGNPLFNKGTSFNSFLEFIAKKNASLCINGDGIDLALISIPKLMRDLPSLIKNIHNFLSGKESKIYFVIGNHDIYIETFLEDSSFFNVAPFLDVISGNKRIHIEHGHIYDRLFTHHPLIDAYLHKLFRLIPSSYDLGIKTQIIYKLLRNKEILNWLSKDSKSQISSNENKRITLYELIKMAIAGNPVRPFPIDSSNYIKAAKELLERGFDSVIFGHTHHPGCYVLGENQNYANSGCWIGKRNHYLEINNGEIILREWEGPSDETHTGKP